MVAQMKNARDRDTLPIKHGVYSLSKSDLEKLAALSGKRV
jgi:hypothetical protein